MDETSTKEKNDSPKFYLGRNEVFLLFIAIFVFIFFHLFFLRAPSRFPEGAIFRIEPGMNLQKISKELKKRNIIKSSVVFESFLMIFGKETRVQSADYFFEKKIPVWSVAYRISTGKHNMSIISITVPEGLNLVKIADIFVSKLPNFNKEIFLSKTKNMEGYLFPDTYFFFRGADHTEVVKVMSENFDKKISSLSDEIILSNKTKEEIIIMASILEGEAGGEKDIETISGILWKRLKIGMPLQVDIWPDTYKTRGLPLKPINNPGLLAIKAAISPKDSPYLYYLHDKDGNIHYAKNFTEHVNNKNRYLK